MFGLLLGAVGSIVAGGLKVAMTLDVVKLTVGLLKVVGDAIACIAKSLGIISPERNVDEIGDRALQAEDQGMTPDNFDSYEAWVRAIEKDDWGYDPEKNADVPLEKKISKGVEVSSAVAIEKFPDLPVEDFLTLAGTNTSFFTVERMAEIGRLANTDEEAFGRIVEYVTGVAKDRTTIDAASDMLMDIEKAIDPGIDDDDAYDRVASFYAAK